MYKTGIFFGKFLPPHRGHINSIINSATQCETLYVIVCDNPKQTKRLCDEAGLPLMNPKLRVKWLSQELQYLPHIKVLCLEEGDMPEYPNGWAEWSSALKDLIPAKIDVFFGGEPNYVEECKQWFPEAEYILFDYKRERYPISATLIRSNPLKYWEYILGSARPFFSKKVLITGTESCGKSTMTKYLAKIFYTSWSEEAGKDYFVKYMGGNENVYTLEDFDRISYMQYELDMHALKTSNKVVFYDTDALITKYYEKIYLGETSEIVEKFIDPSRYDMLLFFTPSVKWVADGQRFLGDDSLRWDLHEKLLSMYKEAGFKNIHIVDGDYNQRLTQSIILVDNLIKGYENGKEREN